MTDDTRPPLPGGTYLTADARKSAARDAYRQSAIHGEPLSPVALAEVFDRSRRWADQRIAEVRAEFAITTNGNGHHPEEDDEPMTLPVTQYLPVADATPSAVTPAIRHITTTAVLAVATVAAVASYDHQRQLAAMAGEGWRSWLLPISVDGLVVAASMAMLVRRRLGEPAGALAWLALLLGGAASVIANVAAADPTLPGRLVAAWPPVALLVSYELLLQQVRTPDYRPTA